MTVPACSSNCKEGKEGKAGLFYGCRSLDSLNIQSALDMVVKCKDRQCLANEISIICSIGARIFSLALRPLKLWAFLQRR